MTITPGTDYPTTGGGVVRVVKVVDGAVKFEVLDAHRASAGGVFTMDEAAFERLIEEGSTMTDKQKIELILKEPNMTPREFNDLPTEARAFLWGKWDDRTESERDLFFEAWSRRPGTLEQAVKNAECTPEEIETAARVLRTIWSYYETNGATPGDKKHQTAKNLIDTIEWRARHDTGRV